MVKILVAFSRLKVPYPELIPLTALLTSSVPEETSVRSDTVAYETGVLLKRPRKIRVPPVCSN